MTPERRRYSDRPTKEGGPFLWIVTMVLAFVGGGVGAVLAVNVAHPYMGLDATSSREATAWASANVVIFLFGAITTTLLAWKAWNKASE